MTVALAGELADLCARHGIRLEAEESMPVKFDAESLRLPPAGVDLRAAVTAFENELIVQALMRTHGNRAQAARLLRMHRTTLVEKIRMKLDTDPDFQARYAELGAAS